MRDAGIHSGDILIVDRAQKVRDKNIIIARLNGELTVKRIRIQKNGVVLSPENDSFQEITVDETMDFEAWGVVRHVIHSVG